MSKSKKINIAIYIMIAILVVSALLPIFISIGKNKDKKDDSVIITDTELQIVDYSIEFKQNTYSINLLSGEIKTNVEVSNVFVNVNGVGCQDLSYSQVLNEDGYYVITLSPAPSLLATCFANDCKITADIYVEYASRSHKVCSKDIDVKSSWTPEY